MIENTNMTEDNLATSLEMSNFLGTLAIVQKNAVFRIMSGKDPAEMKELAVKETMRLQDAEPAHPLLRSSGKCPAGQIYDEVLGKCV